MVNRVLMPRMGSSMEQGKILRWLKKEGDRVEKGDMIAEIETEKVTIQIEAFASGFLRKIVAPEGETVPVGGLIAVIAGAEEPIPPIEQLREGAAAAPTPGPAREAEPARAAPAPTAPAAPERVVASPVARRLAEEHGVDLTQIRGTGPGGRIVKQDVEQFVAQKRAPAAPRAPERVTDRVEEVPLSRIRQAIARQMTTSKQTVPHFYLTMEVDVTEAQRLRRQLNELAAGESKVSVNDLVVAAAARALKKMPEVNASYAGDKIQRKHFVNVGIAVDTPEGLIVPVVHDADQKSLREISRDAKRLAKGARERRLAAEDIEGATFTVTNLGMFGVEHFSGIINPPEGAILAVGAVETKPVVVDGNVTVADRMKLTLSGDHRVIDGAIGARFLQEVKALLETPLSLVV